MNVPSSSSIHMNRRGREKTMNYPTGSMIIYVFGRRELFLCELVVLLLVALVVCIGGSGA
jgi:hypothetical protein